MASASSSSSSSSFSNDPSSHPSLSPSAASVSPPSSLLQMIEESLMTRSWSVLYEYCEEKELECAANSGGDLSRYGMEIDCLYAIMIIAAALNDDLISAKFAWKRVPSLFIDRYSLLRPLWKMIALLIQKDTASFFIESELILNDKQKYIQIIGNNSNNNNNNNNNNSVIMMTTNIFLLLEQLRLITRQKEAELIENAYDSITIEQVQRLLGLKSSSELNDFIGGRGWNIDGKYLLPINKEKKSKENYHTSSGLIDRLSTVITHLEQD